MTETAGPDKVASAERIGLSAREAQASPPRDEASWARKVDRLEVGQREGVRGTNVAGRRLMGPVQGFGKMWQKTYRMEAGSQIEPEHAIAVWKEHFPEFWPKGNRFAGAFGGINPGDVALLDLAIGGGVKLSTGVFVLYADRESFTLMTPQGHMFAGWITFSSEREGDETIVQAQVLIRANDPLYEAAMMLGGHAKEDKFWAATLTALGQRLGVPDPKVTTTTTCVDSKRQWRHARNIWHNSAVRSVFQPPSRARGRSASAENLPGQQPDRGVMRGSPDAVIVGSGPNGLAAAVTLSAAGLKVLVIEGAPTIGGGCRTEELTLPGFWHDVCSAAHPLALASPFFRRFDLPARGVRFASAPVEFAQPLDGGRAAVVTRSVEETAARLGADRRAYRRLFGPPARHMDQILPELLAPLRRIPAHPLAMASYGSRGILPAATVVRTWRTPEARAVMAGAAAHAMMPLTAVPTAGIGIMLVSLAHAVGWPVVAGGSARITDAMAQAVVEAGGTIETGHWVRSLAELPPASATLLDVSPRALISLAGDRLPSRYQAALRRYRYGAGVCKVDFALSGPVPWTNEDCRKAGTLHLGGTFEQMAAAEAEVAAGKHPEHPYVLVVQPGVADPSRAPAGRHTLWTYCHVPAGSGVDMTAAIEAQIERFAPGFRDLILARSVRTAADEEAHNPNYIGGDIAVGMQTMRQTIARPVARWNPYRTPIRGVYLCSSATPPLPGVHGRCGELAALSALRDVFGIREIPDIGPARLPVRSTSPLSRTPPVPLPLPTRALD